MRKLVLGLVLASTLAGCGNGDAEKTRKLEQEVESLKQQVSSLNAALDEERNGPERMLGKVKLSYKTGAYQDVLRGADEMSAKFPGSSEASEALAIKAKAIKAQADQAEQERLAKTRADADRKALLASLAKNLRQETDDIKGITWTSHKTEPLLGKKVALYFGAKDGNAENFPLRIRFQYSSDDWLFVRSLIVKADEQTFNLGSMDFERDNGSGSIWEWSDNVVTNFALVDAMVSANKVTVRFEGRQYYSDFVIPAPQKQAMKEVLAAWQQHGGKRP